MLIVSLQLTDLYDLFYMNIQATENKEAWDNNKLLSGLPYIVIFHQRTLLKILLHIRKAQL